MYGGAQSTSDPLLPHLVLRQVKIPQQYHKLSGIFEHPPTVANTKAFADSLRLGYECYFVIAFSGVCQQLNKSSYTANSPLHAWHLPFSLPITPIIRIFPIVPHFGHRPVVMFFGPLVLGFTVFRRTISLRKVSKSVY